MIPGQHKGNSRVGGRGAVAAALRELGLVFSCLAVALLLLLPLGLLWHHGLGAEEPGRMARRALVPLFILLYVLGGRIGRRQLASAVGWPWWPWQRAVRVYARGWAIGVGTLVVLLLLTVGLDRWRWEISEGQAKTIRRVVGSLFTGVVLVVLEEGLFRGLLQERLRRCGGVWFAVGIGSVIFSAAHFLRPPSWRPQTGLANALDAPLGCLAGVATIPERGDEFLGLLLVGLILALVRAGRPDILLPMGLHAGWFYVRKVFERFYKPVAAEERLGDFWLGSSRFYDGVLAQAILVAVVLVLAGRLRHRLREVARTPLAAARDGGEIAVVGSKKERA